MRTNDRSKFGKVQKIEKLELFRATYVDGRGNEEISVLARDAKGVTYVMGPAEKMLLPASDWLKLDAARAITVGDEEKS